MGNKLCKKKTDVDTAKSPTPFDRIINRLHLRPNSWKSDSHLNQKQVNKSHAKSPNSKDDKNNITIVKPLSKSSDWTDASLEVVDKEEPIHLQNAKLSLIFDNEKSTPVPPPRKHKKGFREKLEAVAKNGLQAFQSKKPVEEPLCVKKTVKATCPLDDHDCAIHNRNHHHEQRKNEINEKQNELTKLNPKLANKEAKRKKNLSVVSLPNYNELKLTVATFDDIDKKSEPSIHESLISLPDEPNKKLTAATSTGKLEICMTRCRSFGSLLPQQLLDKWRVRKIPTDIESDDSFGGLEDWDLRIIEHYNPKDASLPRPRKQQKESKEILSDLESLIVKDEDVEKPKVPVRRSESLLKKINREAAESARKCQSPTQSTPPPSPVPKVVERLPKFENLPTEENGVVEHSSLMKILEQYSIEDKLKAPLADETFPESDEELETIDSSPQLGRSIASIEDFIKNEKLYISKDAQLSTFGNAGIAKA